MDLNISGDTTKKLTQIIMLHVFDVSRDSL